MTWRTHAACRGTDPDLFYPERGDNVGHRQAVAVCRGCPVRAECLDDALAHNEKVGVWGGLSERQRRQLRTIRYDTPGQCPACGTVTPRGQGSASKGLLCEPCRTTRTRESRLNAVRRFRERQRQERKTA